ncbi:MAG: hypothetical protein GY832_31615 [Chloroflexi bacterium]|nr:hypothetical protein [Chloroflexota bacterium]
MPVYAYVCDMCGNREDIVKPMAESSLPVICSGCSDLMRRDLMAGSPRCQKDSYTKDIHSDALAIHPEQRAEHQRLYPDVPLDKACRPVFTNFGQHDAYLEKRGKHKPQGRNRRRMTRIK